MRSSVLGAAQLFHVDTELRTFLVKMAAFEAQGAGGFGHIISRGFELGANGSALELFHASGQRSGCRGLPSSERQSLTDGFLIHLVIGEEQKALDCIAQFAHIAGPRILFERFESGGREGFRLPSILLANALAEMIGQQRDIALAIAQRRQRDGEHVDAVVQILAKRPVLHLLFEIAMRGDDDADIHSNGSRSADALDFAFFENAQQFRLHDGGHVANFVEK